MKKQNILIILAAIIMASVISCKQTSGDKVLIITGQGNHDWQASSTAVKQILDETGLFSTKILITPSKGEDMSGFKPAFSKYKLIVLDYEGDAWPEETDAALRDYLNNGGGMVLYNAKSDSWITKPEPVTLTQRNSFEIRSMAADHPVTKGLPARWLHPDDVIVQGLKPSVDDVKVLATAYSDSTKGGSGKPEPVMVAMNSGQGRIFATMIGLPGGEENQALHCAGSIVTLQRGAEWAATGAVTQEVPSDFPTAAAAVLRPDFKAITTEDAFRMIADYDIQKSTRYYTYLKDQLSKAAGDEQKLLSLEQQMVKVLKNDAATAESKKLMLRELSWMGSENCVQAIKDLVAVEGLKDEAEFALERLGQ
jgi:type 1 glutamine amidotransferase